MQYLPQQSQGTIYLHKDFTKEDTSLGFESPGSWSSILTLINPLLSLPLSMGVRPQSQSPAKCGLVKEGEGSLAERHARRTH